MQQLEETCHAMATLQSHNLSSLSSPPSCPFKLLEHPFRRCHCQCHSNFLCEHVCVCVPATPLQPPLSGVARCRLANSMPSAALSTLHFTFCLFCLFSLLYPEINARREIAEFIRLAYQLIFSDF